MHRRAADDVIDEPAVRHPDVRVSQVGDQVVHKKHHAHVNDRDLCYSARIKVLESPPESSDEEQSEEQFQRLVNGMASIITEWRQRFGRMVYFVELPEEGDFVLKEMPHRNAKVVSRNGQNRINDSGRRSHLPMRAVAE